MTENLLPIIENIATPIIDIIIKDLLFPKIESIIEDKIIRKKIKKQFEKLLLSQYQFCSIINTIVFQNKPRLLLEIYIKQSLIHDKSKKILPADSLIKEYRNTAQNIIIKDSAGVGKTTFLKYLYLEISTKEKSIPIFIELRKLKPNEDIVDFLLEKLNRNEAVFERDSLIKLLRNGDFIFLLDGFDEISQEKKHLIVSEINEFLTNDINNSVFITSRPDKGLYLFKFFEQYRISALTKEQAYLLLSKYDSNGKVSNKLIKELEKTEYHNIEEFLTNPLLTSLLFTAFEYKNSIPLKKHIFYRQVYDALFESHDLTKGDYFIRPKETELDIDDFHRMLRYLGYFTLGNVELSMDELIQKITLCKEEALYKTLVSSKFINDLTTNVPLFIKDGFYYRWAHKSIQEYFIAQFIILDSGAFRKDIFKGIIDKDSLLLFYNILDLIYHMDYKVFKTEVIYEVLKKELKKQKYCSRTNENNEYQEVLLGNGINRISIFSNNDHSTIDINNVFAKEGLKNKKNAINKYNFLLNHSILIYSTLDDTESRFAMHYCKKEEILTDSTDIILNKFTSNKDLNIDDLLDYNSCSHFFKNDEYCSLLGLIIKRLELSKSVLNVGKCKAYINQVENTNSKKNLLLDIINK